MATQTKSGKKSTKVAKELKTIKSLSTRELQIVRLTARECEVPEIARELTLSERLVRKHLCNMLRKLQLAERVADGVRATPQPIAGYSQP